MELGIAGDAKTVFSQLVEEARPVFQGRGELPWVDRLHARRMQTQQTVEKCKETVKRLTEQVQALKEEKSSFIAGISAIQEHTLVSIDQVSPETRNHIESLNNKAKEYGELERLAASLQAELDLTRALTGDDLDLLNSLPQRAIRNVLAGLVLWADADPSHDPSFSPPRHIYSWEKLSLKELLGYALACTLPEAERKALAGRR